MNTSLNAVGRGGVRRSLAAVVAVLVAVLAGLGLGASPAGAHTGGKAIALVEDLTLNPAGTGWQAVAQLADFDGGGPLRAVDVQIKGGGLTAFTPMIESNTAGQYSLAMPKAAAGPVTIEIKVETAPGGTAVTSIDKTYTGTLAAGQSLNLVREKASGGGGGGSNTGMIAGVAGAVLLVAVLYGVFSMRKKSAVPARAK